MADKAETAPIIIKRIKKGGHGHHGGAWKVAYADFVTAMMAFFLLLWLINTTTPEQKAGIADYFTPTIGVKDSKGIGFEGGIRPMQEGLSRSTLTQPGAVIGQLAQGTAPLAPTSDALKQESTSESQAKSDAKAEGQSNQDSELFSITAAEIRQSLRDDPDLQSHQNDIVVEEAPEGLKIDMIDDPKRPMFLPGKAVLTDAGKKLIDAMATLIVKTPNHIMIKGHTDTASAAPNASYTNWELSADRANAARRGLVATQLEPERVMKVLGLSDRELLDEAEPSSPRNRRISIVVMRGSYFRDPKMQPVARGLLSVNDAKVKRKEEAKPEELPSAAESAPSGIFDPAGPGE